MNPWADSIACALAAGICKASLAALRLYEALKAQVGWARAIWTNDREVGAAGVEVPDALAVKYTEKIARRLSMLR